jgi:hypothetical protein
MCCRSVLTGLDLWCTVVRWHRAGNGLQLKEMGTCVSCFERRTFGLALLLSVVVIWVLSGVCIQARTAAPV